MQPNFRRFAPPNPMQTEFLCYSDGMGFSYGPNFRIDRQSFNNYVLMYTVEGLLWCCQDDEKIAVEPGEYIFLDLHRPHCYYFQEGTPSRIAWLHMNGAPVVPIVQQMEKKGLLPVKGKDETMYERILSFFALSDGPEPDVFAQSAACYELLLQIWKSSGSEGAGPAETERQRIFKEQVWQIIAHNLHRPICIEELAEAVSLSKYHFIRVFHKNFGLSPVQFITREKIRRAAYQLQNTSLTVAEIAESLGFAAPGYFAKVFQQIMGCTPSVYREK